MPKVTGITPAQGVTLQATPTTEDTGSSPVPFRKASQRKVERGTQYNLVMLATPQPMNRDVEGTGYLESIDLEVVATAAANGNAVTYLADAPWSALQEVSFKAIGPELFTLSGHDLYLLNLYGGFGLQPGVGPTTLLTVDPMIWEAVVGAGGTGGSFRFTLRIPCAINSRNLIGIMGNQDQGTKYQVRLVLAPSTGIYNQVPTTLPPTVINSYYNYSAVPAPVDNQNRKQLQVPPAYGVLHMANSMRSETAALTGTRTQHYLRQLGNTNRLLILVWRLANGARSDLPLYTLATHTDAQITFRIGDDALIEETASHRRKLMWDRYHFDAPAGVLVYDWMTDFGREPGFEMGDDWLNTENIPNAQFEIQYPAFAGGPATLQIISDMLVIPPTVDVGSSM